MARLRREQRGDRVRHQMRSRDKTLSDEITDGAAIVTEHAAIHGRDNSRFVERLAAINIIAAERKWSSNTGQLQSPCLQL